MVMLAEKYRDRSQTGTATLSDAVGPAPQANFLDVGQGTEENQRDGNVIQCKSLGLNLELEKPAAATTEQLRVLIVRWGGGGQPNLNQVLSAAFNNFYLAHYVQKDQADHLHSYNVLYDKRVVLSDGVSDHLTLPLLLRLDGKQAVYSSNTSTSLEKGNIVMWVITERPTAEGTSVSWTACSRLKFSDNL